MYLRLKIILYIESSAIFWMQLLLIITLYLKIGNNHLCKNHSQSAICMWEFKLKFKRNFLKIPKTLIFVIEVDFFIDKILVFSSLKFSFFLTQIQFFPHLNLVFSLLKFWFFLTQIQFLRGVFESTNFVEKKTTLIF